MIAADRAAAQSLDGADQLSEFRDRFVIADDSIYLAGNSLGRLPVATADRLAELITTDWGTGLVSSWETWCDLPTEAGAVIAGLIGAQPDEVIVTDSTTVNLFKLATAALDLRADRRAVVMAAHEFPTDRFVLEGLAAARRLELRAIDVDTVEGGYDEMATRAADPDVALLVMSHVDYRSGGVAPMADITAQAHRGGALALWDLSHSVGVVPIDLEAEGADLAVGCTYKYLNGGPGSPAFAFVRRALQDEVRQPIWGWFGQRQQFAMAGGYDPEPDVRSLQTGTPSILGMTAADAGARMVAEAGVERIRAKSAELTALAVERYDDWLAPLGFTLGSPRPAARRGGHVSLLHPEGRALSHTLIARAGVVPDFRAPDAIRFGFPPLYTRFVDVWDAFERLRDIAAAGDLTEPPPRRVT